MRCCGSRGNSNNKIANYHINKQTDQLEVVLTNGQTFSISKLELADWLRVGNANTGGIESISLTGSTLVVTNKDGTTSRVNLSSLAPAVTRANSATAGVVELATPAETLAGTDTTKVTTPAGVKSAIQDAITKYAKANPAPTLTPATHSTSGTVTKAQEIFDNAGVSLGFLVR